MTWTVYILSLSTGALYTGATNNLTRRLHQHQKGTAAKNTRGKSPSLVWHSGPLPKPQALSLEARIKTLTRAQKLALIGGKKMTKPFPIQPVFDLVFVKKDPEHTDCGLDLPSSVKGRAVTGTVVAVGPGMRSTEDGQFLTPQVKVGDRVYVKEFSGYVIRYKNEEVHLFQEGEIVGIIREEN